MPTRDTSLYYVNAAKKSFHGFGNYSAGQLYTLSEISAAAQKAKGSRNVHICSDGTQDAFICCAEGAELLRSLKEVISLSTIPLGTVFSEALPLETS